MARQVVNRYTDVCFAHWPVDPGALSEHLPERLALEVRGGDAYLTAVGLRLRPRFLPEGQSFGYMNLRTYASDGDVAGVYFLDLLVGSFPAVLVGRHLYGTPMRRGMVSVERDPSGVEARARTWQGSLAFRVHPEGDPSHPEPGSLDHWLVERHRFFRADGGVETVEQGPWRLQAASGEVLDDGLLSGYPDPTGEPTFHYSPGAVTRLAVERDER